jgi:hypothetical protein
MRRSGWWAVVALVGAVVAAGCGSDPEPLAEPSSSTSSSTGASTSSSTSAGAVARRASTTRTTFAGATTLTTAEVVEAGGLGGVGSGAGPAPSDDPAPAPASEDDGSSPEDGDPPPGVGSPTSGPGATIPVTTVPAPSEVGTWHEVDAGPLSTRSEGVGVWTGHEVIVVGGLIIDQYVAVADGAAFDPATGTWRAIPPVPHGGRILTAAWTGVEVVVGGIGGSSLNPADPYGVFAAYDPARDAWRTLAAPPHTIAGAKAVAVDGRVVWAVPGGAGTTWVVYDPGTDSWSETPPVPASVVRIGGAVDIGGEITAIAATSEGGGPTGLRLATYAPASGTWRLSSLAPGAAAPFTEPGWSRGQVVVFPNDSGPVLAWDAAADSWRSVGVPSSAARWWHPVALADGGAMARSLGITVPRQWWDGVDLVGVTAPSAYRGAGELIVAIDGGVFLFGIRSDGNIVLVHEPNAAWIWTPPA